MKVSTQAKSGYRADIDGIRAFAVLSVLFFHLNPEWLAGGYLGVDIFFVISGYLITGIILRENTRGNFSFSHFYARRIKRIFPALFVVLILSGIAAILLLTPETYVNYMKSSRYASAQLSNFLFSRNVGYFDEGFSGQPLLHTWSLGVEEQFYLFWPLMIFLIFWFISGRRPSAIRKKRRLDSNLPETNTTSIGNDSIYPVVNRGIAIKVATTFIVLSLISYAVSFYLAEENHRLAFYMFYTRAWEFGIGGLVAIGIIPEARTKLFANLAGASGLVLITYSVLFINQEYLGVSFLRFGIILPCIGTALILYSNRQDSFPNKLLASKIPVLIGKISYSLYLYHWPLIIFYSIYANKYEISISVSLAIIAISFLLATLSYLLVEQPARQSHVSNRKVLLLGIFLIIVFSVTSKILEKSGKAPWRITKNSTQSMSHSYRQIIPAECNVKYNNNVQFIECNSATEPNAPIIALIGDSHVNHFLKPLFYWAKSNGFDVISTTSSACPMLLGDVNVKSVFLEKRFLCQNALLQIKPNIIDNSRVRFIMFAQRFDLFFDGKSYDSEAQSVFFMDKDRNKIQDHTNYYRRQLSYTVKKIREAGKEPIIIKQIPLMGNINSCGWEPLIYKILSKDRLCDYDSNFIERWQLPSSIFIDRFVEAHQISTINITPYLNSPVNDGFNIYLDYDHLNEYGIQVIAPYFDNEMNNIMKNFNTDQ